MLILGKQVLSESETFNKTEGFPWSTLDNLKPGLLFSEAL